MIYACREAYTEIGDLDAIYPNLFELLWYSQIPCFDILNITTSANQEHGEAFSNIVWHCFHLPMLNLQE